MKYVFRESPPGWKDWYENTTATPHNTQASFFLRELREWFKRWVFK